METTALTYGTGSIIKNARNKYRPFTARRYKGVNANGKPVYHYLGSYETREQAAQVLLESKELSREDLGNEAMTFKEVFESMIKHYETNSKGTCQFLKGTYRKAKSLWEKPYRSITAQDMEQVVESGGLFGTRGNRKWFFHSMDREAKALGITIRGESQFMKKLVHTQEDIEKARPRLPFSDQEMKKFLLHKDDPDMYLVLILCYTGMRQTELRILQKKNVHLDEGYLVCGIKTEAGRNRKVPIHPIIRPFIESLMQSEGNYLLQGHNGNPVSGSWLASRFQKAIAPYVSEHHVLHETRHSFVTRLILQRADYNMIRRLIGHKLPDVVSRYYFYPTVEELAETVSLLWEDPSAAEPTAVQEPQVVAVQKPVLYPAAS